MWLCRLQWQLRGAKSELQACQQQSRGLGLALRREAGVRRGLEGALAALHYEACPPIILQSTCISSET